ncbi:MAG: YraN family protein [Chloroflexi bacterium]|nr:YraN family protein [Chloroflexota bacterium]
MANRRQTGEAGEDIARQYLRRKGYAILTSNWSTRLGELDIVAERGGVLVFVEVKTRRGADTDAALASITPAKHERMLNAVYQYLHEHDIDPDRQWRIDVIAVALRAAGPPRIDHVEDAFDW